MIETIKDIGSLDAFDSFKWVGDPLAKLNLVYGWNGSGKTTVSRVLNFIERREIHIPDLSNVTFTVATEQRQIRERDLASHTLTIRVFNEDFIHENLHFDDGHAKRIVILGKANIELQKEVASLDIAKASAQQARDGLVARKRELPKIDKVLTDAATAVTQVFANTPMALGTYYGRSYTRARVTKLISEGVIEAKTLADATLTPNQVDAARETVKRDWKEINDQLPSSPDIATLFALAADLLQIQIELPAMDKLSGDKPLLDWTKSGYDLHKSRSAKDCLFCSAPLGAQLLHDLSLFFTNQLDSARTQIDALLDRIGETPLDLESPTVDSGDLLPDLAEHFRQLKATTHKERIARKRRPYAFSDAPDREAGAFA